MSEPLSDETLAGLKRESESIDRSASKRGLSAYGCDLLFDEIDRLKALVAKLSPEGMTVRDQRTEKGTRVTKLVTDGGGKATAFKRKDRDA